LIEKKLTVNSVWAEKNGTESSGIGNLAGVENVRRFR